MQRGKRQTEIKRIGDKKQMRKRRMEIKMKLDLRKRDKCKVNNFMHCLLMLEHVYILFHCLRI